jgi:hypothetical protein
MWPYLQRALLPNPNPIGFGPADFLEFGLAALLLAVAIGWRRWFEAPILRFAKRTALCMVVLALAPVVLRVLILAHQPVPTPDVYDEFSHLLVADTLRHFRLANPPHALPQFFETFFTFQTPTYSSIYSLGQGLILAIGWNLFGLPWAGVLMAMAAFCGLCYWMLRGWTTPGWALAGGVLAVIQFGPLCQWTNSYWGGDLAAAAGCLVFGALPRLRQAPRTRDAALLGTGLAIHLLVRQFESVFLFLAVALYFLPDWRRALHRRNWLRFVIPAAAALAPAVFLTLAQNKAVTGSWTTLPEQLSQYEYGVPAALTFQTPPVPHHPLTPQQSDEYRAQLAFFQGPETVGSYLQRLEYRVRFYRFFFLPPLYLAALAFLTRLRQYRYAWVALTLAIFALGTNFFPAFQYHYVAGVTCLFVLVAVEGLERISRIEIRKHPAGAEAAAIVFLVCFAQFAFWYGIQRNRGPARRISVARQLDGVAGKLLVFVRYGTHHPFQDEWVYNRADIDAARIVWARDLGTAENQKLLRYFPDRVPILLEPDEQPPQLSPYETP